MSKSKKKYVFSIFFHPISEEMRKQVSIIFTIVVATAIIFLLKNNKKCNGLIVSVFNIFFFHSI